jgi:glycosyltransferase involved in cell wall biosynthesis
LILTNALFPLIYNVEIGVNNKIINDLNGRIISKILNKKAIKIPNASNIGNFIDVEIDVTQKKKSLGIGLNRPIVGSVGRLHEQKGFDVLLKAFQIIIKSYPHPLFVIAGDGPLFDELNKLAKDLGIQESIVFLGSRSDVADVLKTYDIFVSSSRWEGLPGVVLESMAAGIPIVATDIPGTNEIIEDKINGLLVEPGNPEKLAEGILAMLSDRDVREKYATAAYKKLSDYSVQNIAKLYETVYQGIYKRPE